MTECHYLVILLQFPTLAIQPLGEPVSPGNTAAFSVSQCHSLGQACASITSKLGESCEAIAG